LLKPATMLILLASAAVTAVAFVPDLPETLAMWLLPFHDKCVSYTPKSVHAELYSALVCGTRLSDPELKQQLARLGLIHLMVVSGAHLLILEAMGKKLLFKLRWARWSLWLILLLFAMANRFQPPVFRALALLSLARANSHFRLGWTRAQMVAVAGMISLCVCADRRALASLSLSWTASLALSLASRRSKLESHGVIYVLLIPALLPLAVPHPTSILTNWIFAPVLGIALFPAALFSFFVPGLARFVDPALDSALWGLNKVMSVAPETFDPLPTGLAWTWIYLACLNLAVIAIERRAR
jgi:hypothetical protein